MNAFPVVLFVDDDETVLAALAATFRHAPVRGVFESNPLAARDALVELQPAAVVSDHRMPKMSGVDLLEAARRATPDAYRILLTGFADVDTAMAAVNQSGVQRIVTKPWEVTELRELVLGAAESVALERFAARNLATHGVLQTVRSLAEAIEAKDPYTRGHSELVGRYAEAIARDVGLTDSEAETARLGGLLHDCGKIGIPERILLKPGRLDEDEFREMRRHPELGARIVAPLRDLPPASTDAVLHHHEHFDGSGYPHHLAGEAIATVARVVHVADAYEAMTARRAYRDPQPRSYIMSELERNTGTQFDPLFARAAMRLVENGTFDTLRSAVNVQPQQPCRELREPHDLGATEPDVGDSDAAVTDAARSA